MLATFKAVNKNWKEITDEATEETQEEEKEKQKQQKRNKKKKIVAGICWQQQRASRCRGGSGECPLTPRIYWQQQRAIQLSSSSAQPLEKSKKRTKKSYKKTRPQEQQQRAAQVCAHRVRCNSCNSCDSKRCNSRGNGRVKAR